MVSQVEHSATRGPFSWDIINFLFDFYSREYKYIPRNANGDSNMLTTTLNRIIALPIWAHAAGAAGSVGYFQWIKGVLDRSYAASEHPVDYATGQTTFDAGMVKGFYAVMQEAGTLGVYVWTQVIDFGFILAMICLAVFVCTLIARFGPEGGWGRRLGVFAAISVFAGAVCDAIENGVSFVMLANPASFADWLILPYSTFASIKFALIALGMLLLIASLLMGAWGRIMNLRTTS
jgi:hypothetical protein